MTVTILGAGAFGTALAVALAASGPVVLWGRALPWSASRENPRLPGVILPDAITLTEAIPDPGAGPVLLAVPMQATAAFLSAHPGAVGRAPVLCSKGVDLQSLRGPSALVAAMIPGSTPAVLTGPSFAADIARSLPTALTLACADDAQGAALQRALSTPVLRLYRSTDVIGAELGGALKNVIAIAAGMVMGAGFGDSARAALMTRGFAEMTRFALRLGARAETLSGLSGFGDLVLTCTSAQSRNFRHGFALGEGQPPDPSQTVEGLATARAVMARAETLGLAQDLPVTAMVAAVSAGELPVREAAARLLSRPLKEE